MNTSLKTIGMATLSLAAAGVLSLSAAAEDATDALIAASARTNFGGVEFPGGAASFADLVVRYQPNFGGGPVPSASNQSSRNVLGVPEQGGLSLGNGGRVTVMFIDNRLTGSGDGAPDLRIFEVGGPETTFVDISKDATTWYSVGTATGFAAAIDIDQYGFGPGDEFQYVRITDDGDSPEGSPFVQGADITAVGAQSSVPAPSGREIIYSVQAHVGGHSQLMIRGNGAQWHHLEGTAPGRGNGFWSVDTSSNAPTIFDSNMGPNLGWIAAGWPAVIGDGTHPESYSSVFEYLTPVFPADGICWYAKKVSGAGEVRLIQQPRADNGHTLVIEFDDLGARDVNNLAGTGFYLVRLIYTGRPC